MRVGDARGGAVIGQSRREVHTRSVEQGEGRHACGIAIRRKLALIITEVVQRAVIAADLVAVKVRGRRNQPRWAQVRLDVECGEVEHVRLRASRGIRADVAVGARVRIFRPIDRHVVTLAVLIQNAGCHADCIVGLPKPGEPQRRRTVAVRVRVHELERGRIDAVYPTAIAPIPGAEAYAEYAVDDRGTDRQAGFIAGRTALRVGRLALGVDARFGEAGLHRDVAHRAALRPGAEQRSLRTAQHFDAVEVEELDQRIVGIEAQIAHLNRGIVDVDSGGSRSTTRGDAANRDLVRLAGVEGHSGREPDDVREVLDALLVDRVLVDGGNADRYSTDAFLSTRRRHYDFRQGTRGGCVGGAAGIGRARKGCSASAGGHYKCA